MEKSKTRIMIANEYGIDRKTLRRWFKKENIYVSNGLVTPEEQKKIYKKFGKPKAKSKKTGDKNNWRWR